MPIKLVIFDLDGTLVNAYQAVADSVNFALEQMGYSKQDDYAIQRSVGWGERSLIASFVDEKDVDEMQMIYRENHKQTLTYGVKFLDGALKLLKKLKEDGYGLAIATNRSAWSTKIILRELQIEKYFDLVLTKDEVDNPKPHPEILERLLKMFSLDPAEVIYVGDMTIDVETGNNAGVKTIAVSTGSSTKEELEALKPLGIIDNVGELAWIISEFNKRVEKGECFD